MKAVARQQDVKIDIAAEERRLNGASAAAILTWAARRFAPRLTLATGFGMEGCVLIDLVARLRLPVDLFTLDTGLFFPETLDLWNRLEQHYGVTIRSVRPLQNLDEQAAAHGARLWERDPDRCCELRKVEPLRRELAGRDAWVTAIRRQQTAARAMARIVEWDGNFGLVKVNPLAAWTEADVHTYIQRHGVPVNPLHARGYSSIGCMPCTTPVGKTEEVRAGRWRGQDKTECGLHARPTSVPSTVSLHPIFLKLAGKRVVVVGGGPLAAAKVRPLLASGAEVVVVSPELSSAIAGLDVQVTMRRFQATDLDGAWLVVAAAPAQVNRQVEAAASERRIFVNAVDDPERATAYAGSIVRRGPLTLAISTAGRAPALAALIRRGLERLLPALPELSRWMAIADGLRAAWKKEGTPMKQRRPQLLEAINRAHETGGGTS